MARPLKRTVDYFPHFVNTGKTMLILQNEFGNDGYAFWFKLLSLLCKTDGQVYDYNNPASWRLLLAETAVTEDIANRVLQLLADIEAIDPALYLGKVIWVQNLVDNLGDVYTRRRNGSVPSRPVIDNRNPVNVSRKPQTRPDHTKGKPDQTIMPDFIDKEVWEAFLEMRKKKKDIPTTYGEKLLFGELEKIRLSGDDPNEVLKKSIMNGWKGIFPPDKKGGGNGVNQRSPRSLPKVYTRPEDL